MRVKLWNRCNVKFLESPQVEQALVATVHKLTNNSIPMHVVILHAVRKNLNIA